MIPAGVSRSNSLTAYQIDYPGLILRVLLQSINLSNPRAQFFCNEPVWILSLLRKWWGQRNVLQSIEQILILALKEIKSLTMAA
jgi:hypothetical protein